MTANAIHPKRLSAEERKKQILAHTFRLISQQGFKTVSLRDIAASAQINEALIYRHFPTKADLLRAVLSEMVNRQPVQSTELPVDLEAFTQQLSSFIDFFIENNQRDPSVIKIILYAVMEDFPLPNEFNLQKEGTFLNWLVRSIEKGKTGWGFDPELPALLAISSFMGGLIFYIMQTAVLKNAPALDIEEFKSAFITSFLRSLFVFSER
jgi:AcrR family transcriptional regulator